MRKPILVLVVSTMAALGSSNPLAGCLYLSTGTLVETARSYPR